MTEAFAVPHDIDAERAVLGGALLHRSTRDLLVDEVPPAAFYDEGHRRVAAAVVALASRGEGVDPVTVRTELVARDDVDDDVQRRLLELGAYGVLGDHARTLAGVVLDCWARRNALASLIAAQRDACDRSRPLDRVVEAATSAAEQAGLPTVKAKPATDVETFLAVDDPESDWIVPGVLERSERVIITGTEGAGKSWWCRTFAAQVAAGMHPFTEKLMTPRRVLIIDLENSEKQVRRALRPIWRDLKRQQFPCDPSNLRLEIRGQGMDLLNSPADARWLKACVEANRPDVLVTGPIYKLGGTSNKEDEAGKVARILDDIRTRYGCALLLEAHAPHGDAQGPTGRNLRPFGASLWLRWPEFGFGLQWDREDDPDRYRLQHWRGQREVRAWPLAVVKTHRNIPWGVRPADQAKGTW